MCDALRSTTHTDRQLYLFSPPLLMPYPQALMQDCTTYYRITGRRVTFEYTLLAGINDAPEHVSKGLLGAGGAACPPACLLFDVRWCCVRGGGGAGVRSPVHDVLNMM